MTELLTTMSLAVRERPTTLADMVGNEANKKMINGFFANKRLPNTILFSGEHGQGKTTMSRIFARMVMCKTNDACGTCFGCTSFANSMNFEEVNIGAQGGVDTARELISRSKISPTMGSKRIFLLDEVHKLTGSAASALLKELEEPSKDTIWMLATNMPDKLLATIRSRCTHIKVQTPSPKEIATYLWRIAKKEAGKNLNKELQPLFMQMAKMSGGHVRDAVQMLEVFLAMTDNGKEANINIDEVLDAFASADEQSADNLVLEIMYSLAQGKASNVVKGLMGLDNARTFLYKARFFIDLKIAKWAGTAKFYTPNHKIFDEKVGANANSPAMIMMLNNLQASLIDLEQKFNTVPGLDERIGMQTELLQHCSRWAAKMKS